MKEKILAVGSAAAIAAGAFIGPIATITCSNAAMMSASAATPITEDITYGDINDDGIINSVDAVIILQEYAKYLVNGKYSIGANQISCADINEDNKIDSSDAVIVLRYYAADLVEPLDVDIKSFYFGNYTGKSNIGTYSSKGTATDIDSFDFDETIDKYYIHIFPKYNAKEKYNLNDLVDGYVNKKVWKNHSISFNFTKEKISEIKEAHDMFLNKDYSSKGSGFDNIDFNDMNTSVTPDAENPKLYYTVCYYVYEYYIKNGLKGKIGDKYIIEYSSYEFMDTSKL